MKNIRHLQNNESSINNTFLKYLEIDKRCIESNTNYLRQGNANLIPLLYLDPKDENNNPLNNLRDKTIYSKRFLKSLINITDSKGAHIKKHVSVNKNDNKIAVHLESHISGEFYVTSSYFKYNNFDKFIINVKSGNLFLENTFAEINEQPEYIAGNNIILKIYPKDKYGNQLDDIKDGDLNFEIFILFPDNSTSVEKGSYNTSDKIIELNKTLIIAGKTIFKIKYNNNSDIECKNCEIQIKPNKFLFDNIKVNFYNNDSFVELKEDQKNLINKNNTLIFELFTYDEYNNIINDNLNIELVPNFLGLDSNISLCYENKNSKINIFLCEEESNLRKYYYLINGEYFLVIKYLNQTKNYTLEINGDFSADDASNGNILLSETYLSNNQINGTAGELEEFVIELRSYDGKRNNFWFKNPNEEIILVFKENDSCSYDIFLGEKPGQYSIKFNCTKKYNENEITLIIQENELDKKVSFDINPNIRAKEIIFDYKNNTIENDLLPAGYLYDYYIIKLQFLDKYDNIIDCKNNMNLSYQFSNSNDTRTEIYCEMNNIIMNNSFSNTGNYTLFLISLNKSYSFLIYGEPSINFISFSEEIETGQKLKLSISLTDIKDKENNTIPLDAFLDNMVIKCEDSVGTIYNFSYNINNNSDIVEYTSNDNIKGPNLQWHFFYNNENLTYLNEKYTTKVIIKCTPSNSEVYITDDINIYDKNVLKEYSVYSINGDNAYITIYLKDKFGNYINNDDEVEISKSSDGDNVCEDMKMDHIYERRIKIIVNEAGQSDGYLSIKKGDEIKGFQFTMDKSCY